MAYRKSSIKPPYLLSSSFEEGEGRRGLIETRNLFGGGRGLFNLEKTMVSVLHKEQEHKVPRFFVSNNQFCSIAGTFLPTTRALIGYFEVTQHLTKKLFPTEISERATLQNL